MMSSSPIPSIADIKATPPGVLEGVLQYCEKKLISKSQGDSCSHPELENLKYLVELIREELGQTPGFGRKTSPRNVTVLETHRQHAPTISRSSLTEAA